MGLHVRVKFRQRCKMLYLYVSVAILLGGCTAQFMSDLVGTPEDRFSHNEAQMLYLYVSVAIQLTTTFSSEIREFA